MTSLASASVTSFLVGASVSLVGQHFLRDTPTLVLALTVLAGWMWDWTTDLVRKEARTLAFRRIKAALEAAFEALFDRKDPKQ